MLRSLTTAFLLLVGLFSFGSHVPGGYLTYECVGTNQYEITLTLFEDCGTAFIGQQPQTVQFTNDCGFNTPTSLDLTNTVHQLEVSDLCGGVNSECQGGIYPGIYMHQWSSVVTFPGTCDAWTVSYQSCCMNTSTNVSGQPGYYWEANIFSETDNCNSSAYPLNPGTPYFCVGAPSSLNFEFVDPDGDSLNFSLVSAQSAPGINVTYNGGYSGSQPIPGITIDPQTGQMDFTIGMAGNYVLAVLVEEYENGVLVGSQVYEAQVYGVNCSGNNAPVSSGISSVTGAQFASGNTLYTCDGSPVCFDVEFSDADASDVLTLQHNADVSLSGVTANVTGSNPATLSICIPPQGVNGTFMFYITANDSVCPVPGEGVQPIVFVIGDPGLEIGPDQTFCGGNNITLNLGGSQNITWTSISGAPINVGTNFSCNPCSSPVASPSVTTTYVGEVTDSCGNTDYDTVMVTVVPAASVSVPDTVDQCGEFIIDPVNSDGLTNYTWYDSILNVVSTDTMILNTMMDQGYSLLYVEVNAGGCSDTDTVVVGNFDIGLNLMADDTVLCGNNSTGIIAETNFSGIILDNFDDCPDMSIWNTVNNGNCGQMGCGTMSGSGDAVYFDGPNGPRSIISNALNTQSCSTIDFCLFFGNDVSSNGPGNPCENADATENVQLQYSTNGGASWNIMQIFYEYDWDAGGPYEDAWQCFSVNIPPAAVSTSTIFRFVQPNFSGCTGCDNWSLDNVQFNCTTAGVGFDWTGTNIIDTAGYVSMIDSASAGTTYITVTDSITGCVAMDSIVIHPGSSIPVSLSFNDSTLCVGSWTTGFASPDLAACPLCQYTWSGGTFAGGQDDEKFIQATGNDLIIVDVVNPGSGCSGSDTLLLESDSIGIDLQPTVDSICHNGVFALSGTYTGMWPDSTYTVTWADFSTGGTLVVQNDSSAFFYNLTQGGWVEFSVTGDPEFGCSAQEFAQVSLIYPDTNGVGTINGQNLVVQNSGWAYSGTYSPLWTPTWNVTGGTILAGQGTNTISVNWGPTGQGLVELILTDVNGCGYDTLSMIVSIIPTSIEEYSSGVVKAYPNPASSTLNLEGLDDLDSDGPLSIVDVTGRKVLSIDPKTDRESVNVSGLRNGSYLILDDTGQPIVRFMISR